MVLIRGEIVWGRTWEEVFSGRVTSSSSCDTLAAMVITSLCDIFLQRKLKVRQVQVVNTANDRYFAVVIRREDESCQQHI